MSHSSPIPSHALVSSVLCLSVTLLPGSGLAQLPCEHGSVQIGYEADTIPEQDSNAPWELILNQQTAPTYYSDGGQLFLNGYDIYLDDPQADNNGYLFYRDEPALAGAERYSMEARVHVVAGRYPPQGPFDAGYVAYGVVDDGHKRAAIITGPDPAAGELLVVGNEQVFSAPCTDWFAPTTYRLEIDRADPDPQQHTLDLYTDGSYCMTVPYAALLDSEQYQPGFYFGGRDSDSVWDFVAYEVCNAAPVARASMDEQIANMQDEASQLDAPRWYRLWLDRRLERIERMGNPKRQFLALSRLGRGLFIMKRVGIVEEDASQLETQLDFARTTVEPDSSREHGYFRRLTITSSDFVSPIAVPGQTSARALLAVDLRPASDHINNNQGSRNFALMARTSIVDIASGKVVRVKTTSIPLPDTLPAGQIYSVLNVEFEWDGLRDDVTPVDDGAWFMDTSVQYVELDNVGGVVSYFDCVALNGDVVSINPYDLTQPRQILYTDVLYPVYYNQSCSNVVDCGSIQGDPYDNNYGTSICAHPYHFADGQRRCVRACTEHSHCAHYGEGWACWGLSPADPTHDPFFPGYCYLKDSERGAPIVAFDSDTGWVHPEYQNSIYLLNVKEFLEDIVVFHEHNLHGIWSLVHQDTPYRVYLEGVGGTYGEEDNPNFGAGAWAAGAGWSSKDGGTQLYYWHALRDGGLIPPNPDVAEMYYYWLGHEFTHALMKGLFPSQGCLEENIPDIFGSLVKVKHLGGASAHTDASGETIWGDKTCGLEPGCNDLLMPFAQRSAFDWVECFDEAGVPFVEGDTCPPYLNHVGYWCSNSVDIHRNGPIWGRFLRVLSEGTGTFDLDGNGEDVGVELEYLPGMGIGLENTTVIIYETVIRAADLYSTTGERISLRQWVDLLRESGCDLGFCAEIETALGIAGFFSDWYSLQLPCEGAPSAATFSAWSGSVLNDFIGFKDWWSDEVGVRYHIGNDPVIDRIAAHTDTPPALIEYEERLYVFWRAQGTGSIKYLWYEPGGSTSVVHTLHDLRADGTFDVVVFDNRLHVVYTDNQEVRIGWCSPLIEGGDCSWHRYDDHNLSKSLGVFASPGLGADAGSGLAGTSAPDEEHLYIATSFAGPYFATTIKIYQVDKNGDVEHAIWVPDYYPSYQTTDEIAIRLVRSAFPNGNYLYLAWRDISDSKMYKAVLRHFDDSTTDWNVPHDDYWITWSHDTKLEVDSGVRLKKGTGVATNGVDFYFELQDWVGIANQVGLY